MHIIEDLISITVYPALAANVTPYGSNVPMSCVEAH